MRYTTGRDTEPKLAALREAAQDETVFIEIRNASSRSPDTSSTPETIAQP
jgi:hypothetical protein